MAVLEIENVVKSFNGKTKVLDGVSLKIEKGEFVSIVGASGSGKSTLLTILGGIDKPTEGKVYVCGEDITNKSEKELAILRRTKVGFVFQFFNLAPYLTVKENILLPIMLDRKSVKRYQSEAQRLMEFLGITEHINKLPAMLSGGEQQRVAIARGMIFKPDIILLDEPTGNLDSKTGVEIMELLKKVNEETGATIVQVTHSEENARYANRIISIKDGKITQEIVNKEGNNFQKLSEIGECNIEING